METEKRLTIRLSESQHERIAKSSKNLGMSVNTYVVTVALAQGREIEAVTMIRDLIREQNAAQAEAINEGLAVVIAALDEHAAARERTANERSEKQIAATAEGLRSALGWMKNNIAMKG